jgi:hypothetical protein
MWDWQACPCLQRNVVAAHSYATAHLHQLDRLSLGNRTLSDAFADRIRAFLQRLGSGGADIYAVSLVCRGPVVCCICVVLRWSPVYCLACAVTANHSGPT